MFSGLILSAFLQVGILQGASVIYVPPEQIPVYDLPAYMTISARAEYGPFFAETSIRTDAMPVYLDTWIPMQNTYMIGGGLSFKGITIGMQHTCYHPTMVYMVYGGYSVIPSFEGGTNDFYIRLDIGGKH